MNYLSCLNMTLVQGMSLPLVLCRYLVLVEAHMCPIEVDTCQVEVVDEVVVETMGLYGA